MNLLNKCTDFFTKSPVYNPRPRFTLEEIAQRYAMQNGLAYRAVLKRLQSAMYGKGVIK